MQAIQTYYRTKARDPSDVELETIAQTWSEHCSHKTFRADITLTHDKQPEKIPGLLKTYIRAATETLAAPWIRSAFVDNAGIIEFDDEYDISFKVETHNHPSAIEPFGGANTGLGGVIRDVLGVSARPIAATDIFCFGFPHAAFSDLPSEALHPRRIRSGVVAGVQDYGNKTGIPTVNGAIVYDADFTANPLVFCGCVGLAPRDSHPRHPKPGDHRWRSRFDTMDGLASAWPTRSCSRPCWCSSWFSSRHSRARGRSIATSCAAMSPLPPATSSATNHPN